MTIFSWTSKENLPKIVIFVQISLYPKKKMNGFGKIFKGPHGGFFKFAAVATGIFVLLMVFKPGTNVIRWIQSGLEIRQQEKQIRQYEEEIGRMEHRIRMLTSDRDTLEEFAREEFHFAEPGDDVYIVEE